MARFSEKYLTLIKGIFDCIKDSYYVESSDKSSIDAYINNYQFCFIQLDDCFYLTIFKYNRGDCQCKFRDTFDSFSTMILCLQGYIYTIFHNCKV